MTRSFRAFPVLCLGAALLSTACSVSAPITPEETQIKTDLAADRFMPATRHMRDAIETQELFAQAAFWSNEYDLNPSDLEAAIKLASAVRRLGNPGRAIEITQTTRALYPRDPYLLAEYAAALIADERSFDAVGILDEGLAVAPAYGRLWSLKGAALDQQERYAEARQHYDRALRITPNDPNVMANIGLSYALAGDAATAEGWLRRAIDLPGASPSIRQNLVIVLQLQGKTDEADALAALNARSRGRSAQSPSWSQAGQHRAPSARAVSPAPTMRGAMPPATLSPQARAQQARMPQARLSTGTAPGQQFKSASEAARAMAQGKPGINAYESGRPPAQTASPEAQKAMLDRISRSLQSPGAGSPVPPQGQPLRPQTSAQSVPPQRTQPRVVPQSYPQQPPLAGAPQQQRREPNRRRR